MKNMLFIIGFTLMVNYSFSQTDKQVKIEYFETVSYTQIRALEVYSDDIVWFAGYKGVWGYTENAGNTWHIDSIKNASSELNFRSMAMLNDSTVLLMSIASPAYIYKTTNKGKNWKIVYQNNDKDIFFDCLKFYDDKNGYALADPIDGCMQMFTTNDAGENWKSINCDDLPTLEKGEAFFATSNTNIDIQPPQIWIASGGKRSRIWKSNNLGRSYKSHEIPLPQGEQMTGIFTMDFFDAKIGAIAGGNYDKRDSILNCLAITNDGGNTWKNIPFNKPIFGSCVQFKNSNELFLTGHSGSVYLRISDKKYFYLKDQFNNSINFHTLRISPSKRFVWLAGTKGKIARFSN